MTARHKLLVSLGALGLVVLVWRIDLNAVQLALFHVGWGMALVLSQEIVAHVLNASGWRFAFTREVAARFSFGELVRLRVAGDAINYLTPTATIGRSTSENLNIEFRHDLLPQRLLPTCRPVARRLGRSLQVPSRPSKA